jgi:hypothetical protein
MPLCSTTVHQNVFCANSQTNATPCNTLPLLPQVKAEQPGLTFAELSKAIGERWKAATPEDKAPFEEKARAVRAAHSQECSRNDHECRYLYIMAALCLSQNS